jgi:hypothetical protein
MAGFRKVHSGVANNLPNLAGPLPPAHSLDYRVAVDSPTSTVGRAMRDFFEDRWQGMVVVGAIGIAWVIMAVLGV